MRNLLVIAESDVAGAGSKSPGATAAISAHIEYRADIDGLRAISVLLVLLFHLGLSTFSGGYVGVDVFFVISGYLITAVILRSIKANRFSLVWFYDRRARRILPALIAVIIATLIAGYVLLLPGSYATSGWSAGSALFAVSNFFFLHNTGYFDAPSQMMPLLHTWSLGVEEQFYLVWPAVVFAASKIIGDKSRFWRILLLAIIASSFASALIHLRFDAKAAFYLPQTRAWELAVGALMNFVPPLPRQRWFREGLSLAGLAGIVTASLMLTPLDPFPGLNALPPVLGAALIIYPSRRASLVGRSLAIVPLAFLGRISFSLYLWHWPLIVFWRIYTNGAPLNRVSMAVIAATSCLLAILSWRFVEQPFRHLQLSSRKVLTGALGAGAVVACLVGLVVSTAGLPFRVPPNTLALSSLSTMWNWQCPQTVPLGQLGAWSMSASPSCVFGANWELAKFHGVVWGDSIAESISPLMNLAGRRSDVALALIPACSGVVALDDNFRGSNGVEKNAWCQASRVKTLELLSSDTRLDFVIVAALWPTLPSLLDDGHPARGLELFQSRLDDFLGQIRKENRQIVLFADPTPFLGIDPVSCFLSVHALPRQPCPIDPDHIQLSTVRYQASTHDILKQAAARYPGVGILDPADFLCDATQCRTVVNDEFIYRDTVHFRRNLRPETIEAMVNLLHLASIFDPAKPRPDH